MKHWYDQVSCNWKAYVIYCKIVFGAVNIEKLVTECMKTLQHNSFQESILPSNEVLEQLDKEHITISVVSL